MEKTGKGSFTEDNGGKSHSKNTGQQLRGSVSKDAVPLAVRVTLLSRGCV